MEKMNMFSKGEKTIPVGIDLGTTNTAIAVLGNGGVPSIIPMYKHKVTLPSCVMWDSKTDKYIVGEEAYINRYKSNVIYSVKRLMGTDETITLVDGDKTKVVTPVEMSAGILKEAVRKASENYGNIKDVVVTVPAYFGDKQVSDTEKAGKLAGLNVLKIFREPTAASLFYAKEIEKKSSKILIYDLGGGTFDITLVNIIQRKPCKELDDFYGFKFDRKEESSGQTILSVLKTDGDTRLGGDDIDNELLNICLERLKDKGYDTNLLTKEQLEELRLKMESKKKDGSAAYEIHLDYVLKDGSNLKDIIQIYPVDFTNSTMKIYEKTRKIMKRVLSDVNVNELDAIVLVGGSTKSIYIKEFLKRDFPNIKINDALNPDEAVALGAAIEAKRLKFNDINMKVYDVLPLAIGVLADGKVQKVIQQNQSVPYAKSSIYQTTVDNQKEIKVCIYQGNSIFPEECTYLGHLIIDNLEPKPAGEAQIVVNLSVNANGLLKVSVSIDDKVKEVTLTNLFASKDEKKPTNPINKNNRKLNRWRAFANSLSDPSELNELLDKFENGEISQSIIVDYIQQHQ